MVEILVAINWLFPIHKNGNRIHLNDYRDKVLSFLFLLIVAIKMQPI